MKTIKYMLAATLLCSSISYAEDNDEIFIDAIEVTHFMVNWSPNSANLGRVIMARCPQCAPETMTFDKNTELVINNKNHPIETIGSKTDWSGLITVTNQSPSKIIKFTIYPSQPGE